MKNRKKRIPTKDENKKIHIKSIKWIKRIKSKENKKKKENIIKKKQKKTIIVTSFLLIVMLFSCFLGNPQKLKASQQNGIKKEMTVRVGIFSLGSFQGWDEKKNPAGYNIELLEKIAERTHWKYEYVACENWVDATEKLENGEIDLLAPAQKEESLTEKFAFSTQIMGTEAAAIYTKAENETYLYEDFGLMKHLTYGCVKDSTFTKKFKNEYAVEHELNPAIKYYTNTTELFQALESEEVDAVVTNIMFGSDERKILGWFSPLSVYYISQKENQKLLDELDSAMLEIMIEEPKFQAQLMSQFFSFYDNEEFSYDELAYIKSLSVLKVGYLTDMRPIADTDKNGEYQGMTRDIFDILANTIGISVEYVPLKKENQTEEYLREQDIHIIANYKYKDGSMEFPLEAAKCSISYLDLNQVFVVPVDAVNVEDSVLRVGVVNRNFFLSGKMKENYPNMELITYDTLEECFQAVRKGEADIILGNRYCVEPYLSKPQNDDFKMIQARNTDSKCCVAVVNYGENEERLIRIFNKAINQLTEDDVNTIVLTNVSENTYRFTLMDFAYQYRYALAILTILLAIIVILLILSMKEKKKSMLVIMNKNEQLAEAIERANNANDAKSRFLAQMSHEIRTPMTAIIGLTQIAENETEHSEKVRDYLEKIEISSKHLLKILNEILDMSAIENQKIKIAEEEFNFKQLIYDISNIYYQQCKQKNVDFSVKIHGITEEFLIGDSLRVNQILMNLLSNAVKFTEDGGEVTFEVLQGSVSFDLVHMRILVSDTGCGMSEEMKSRLFQPFEQEDAMTAKKHGGSGLGLSISKNLVELMGGNIQIEERQEKGNTFVVDLPFKRIRNSEKTVKAEKFSEIRMLVVEDEREECKSEEVFLEHLGVKYESVKGCEKALEYLGEAESRGEKIHVCLMMEKMEEMNGVDLARQIQMIFGNATTTIIISDERKKELEEIKNGLDIAYFVPKGLFQSSIFNILMEINWKNQQSHLEKKKMEEKKYQALKNHKVLVAEDVELNMEVIVSLLKMVEIEVDCAKDGAKAVSLYLESKVGEYSAILLDINMPELDGYEVAEKIRASEKEDAKTVPIFAMTANAYTEDVKKALDAGMNGHLAKPIETQILYQILENAFQKEEENDEFVHTVSSWD